MRNYVLPIFLFSYLSTISPNISEQNVKQSINYSDFTLDTKELALYKSNTKNNPFNIRASKSNNWVGKVTDTSYVFEAFQSRELGIRAGLRLIRNYGKNHKLTTISRVITKYAPKNENDTERYINNVSKLTGFEKNQQIDLTDATTLIAMANAISICEGNAVSKDELAKVYVKYF